MATETSVNSIVNIVSILVGFMVVAVVVNSAFPQMMEDAEFFLKNVFEIALNLLGMTIRGCDDTSVKSIEALKFALDCTAYIHANERCVHLDNVEVVGPLGKKYDDFKPGDSDTYDADDSEGILNMLPLDIKRVKFWLKHRDGGGEGTSKYWYLEDFTIFQNIIDPMGNTIPMLAAHMEHNDWLRISDDPAESSTQWYEMNYSGMIKAIPMDMRTNSYSIVVKTGDVEGSGYEGTDHDVYFCFSSVDEERDSEYAKCMSGKSFGGPVVRCEDTGNIYGGCKVENFKIKQRGATLFGTQQPDCVVYYETFPSGEDAYWMPDVHNYDWAYIAIGGGAGVIFGGGLSALGKGARMTVNPAGTILDAGSVFIKAGKEAPTALRGLIKYVDNVAERLARASGKIVMTESEYAERKALHAVTESFYRSGGFTSSRVEDVGVELFDNIKIRFTDDTYEYWKRLGLVEVDDVSKKAVIEKHLKDAVDEEIDNAIKKGIINADDVSDIAAIKKALTGGDEEFYAKMANDYSAVFTGAAEANKYGYSVEKLFVKTNIFMDALEKPASYPTGKAYRDYLTHQSYVMMNELSDMEMRERMMFHATTFAKMGVNSVAFRNAAIKLIADDPTVNETVVDMLEGSFLNKDQAEAWAKCINAARGIGGKALCSALAYAGIETMYRYSKLQIFEPVGLNALGYYRPFDDYATKVELNGISNYYYVELDRENTRDTRFHLASPCTGTIEVSHERCECNTGDSEGSYGDHPNYFLDVHNDETDGNVFKSRLPSENPTGDGKLDTYPEIYSYRLDTKPSDCVLNIIEIHDQKCSDSNAETCKKLNKLYEKIGSPLTMNDMVCCRSVSSSPYIFVPREICEAFSDMSLSILSGIPGIENCMDNNFNIKDDDYCGTEEERYQAAARDNEGFPITTSIGAYVDKEYKWPGFWRGYTEKTYYTAFPMVFTGMKNELIPDKVYGVKDLTERTYILNSDYPLDIGWNNLFPLRMTNFNDVMYEHYDDIQRKNILSSIPTTNYQAQQADLNLHNDENSIPSLYMGPDSLGVKECLSKSDASGEWKHANRKGNDVECLKVSVTPQSGSWDPDGENYCYHDLSSQEVTWQLINVAGWMTVEWGVTAIAAAASGGTAGVGAKAAMGFVAGAGSEYTSQRINKQFAQVWPGHPE